MAKRDRLSGNEAVAIALRQINPDVFAAFPITPIVSIPEIEQSHQQTFSTMPKDLSDHAGTGNRGGYI